MKTKLLIFIILVQIVSFYVDAQVKVKGYYRKDGTYVKPHYRSSPDGNPKNNWSYPGNTNLNTGEISTGNPDTYLKRYDNGATYGSGNPTFSVPSTTIRTEKPTRNYFNSVSYSTHIVTVNSLNVRSGPSKNNSVIGSLSYADNVEVVDSYSNGWVKINYTQYNLGTFSKKTETGYVFGTYVSRNYALDEGTPSYLNSFNSTSTTDVVSFWDELNLSGFATQIDTDEKWNVKIFQVHTGDYHIVYPYLNCGGKLKVISKNANQMVLKEILTYGQSNCTNDGYVVLKKKNNSHVYFEYFWPNIERLGAEGLLSN